MKTTTARPVTVRDARETALRLVDKCRYAQRFHDQPAVKRHGLRMMAIYLIDVDRIDFEGLFRNKGDVQKDNRRG